MPINIIISVVAIILALVFYTAGVWGERFTRKLKVWHVVLFWLGFVFDTIGTTIMAQLAGKIDFDLHGITGVLAIVLMFCNAVWATIVLIKKDEKAIQTFHKFSIFVWLVWLIPFITGMIGAMAK